MDSRSSVRKPSAASGINKSSVHVILKCDLNLKPFKIQPAHEMKPGDDVKRLEFCRKIQHLSASGELNTEKIIFSDESHVYLRSVPNKQNNREWLPEKPQASNAVPLHSLKVSLVRDHFVKSAWSVLFRRWHWICCDSDKRTLCGDAGTFLPRGLSRNLLWNIFPARRSHTAHSKTLYGLVEGTFSWKIDLFQIGFSLASTITGPEPTWLLFLGIHEEWNLEIKSSNHGRHQREDSGILCIHWWWCSAPRDSKLQF